MASALLRPLTIARFNAVTGEIVAGPFTGHTEPDPIRFVTFFPNRQQIASASRDFTIRVWDATKGELLVGPLIGHTDSVFSVVRGRIASAVYGMPQRERSQWGHPPDIPERAILLLSRQMDSVLPQPLPITQFACGMPH